MKNFPHSTHGDFHASEILWCLVFLSDMWLSLWVTARSFLAKLFGHCSQPNGLYGSNPRCLRTWTVFLAFEWKAFEQIWQTKFMCLEQSSHFHDIFWPHSLQGKILWSMSTCLLNFLFVSNLSPHIVHTISVPYILKVGYFLLLIFCGFDSSLDLLGLVSILWLLVSFTNWGLSKLSILPCSHWTLSYVLLIGLLCTWTQTPGWLLKSVLRRRSLQSGHLY